MATYKVLQDIEAEDKFIGPLTLKQFIFAGIAFVSTYISILLLTKHAGILAIPLVPVILVSGFLAFPWGRDQPTEIWLLAKIRFFLKPKRRIWNQSGVEELVTITAPKKVVEYLGSNLSQTEVKSRLKALAETIDSRGWAVKNVNVNLFAQPATAYQDPASDRLIDVASLPKAVSNVDVQASDDIMDERNNPTALHLSQMITESAMAHRQETLEHMKQVAKTDSKPHADASAKRPTGPPADYWFMDQAQPGHAPAGYATFGAQQVVAPGDDDTPLAGAGKPLTPSEQALVAKLESEEGKPLVAYGHTKVIQPFNEHKSSAKKQPKPHPSSSHHAVTQTPDPAILNLANNDDLTVATIARQANKKREGELPKDEVIVSLR